MSAASLDSMRAFVALNLDIASVRHLAEVARRLRASALAPTAPPISSWTAPTKMHVTLKFFGAIDVGLAPPLVDLLRPLAAGKNAPRPRIVTLTAFPSPSAARVIVAELDDPAGELGALQANVEAQCAELGFAREARPFRAHVTMARTRAPIDARAWLEGETAAHPVGADTIATELVLYRSDLARSGAEYTALFRAPFTFTRMVRPPKPVSRRTSRPPPPASINEPLAFPSPPRLPSEKPPT